MRGLVALCIVGGLGCDKPLTGSYVGTGAEKGKASIDIGPGSKPGEVIVNAWNTDRPRGNFGAKVEVAAENKLRISFLECGVVFDQSPPPNDHQATVTAAPQQVCDVEIDHYKVRSSSPERRSSIASSPRSPCTSTAARRTNRRRASSGR